MYQVTECFLDFPSLLQNQWNNRLTLKLEQLIRTSNGFFKISFIKLAFKKLIATLGPQWFCEFISTDQNVLYTFCGCI